MTELLGSLEIVAWGEPAARRLEDDYKPPSFHKQEI
jgi:hypothetical protein